MQRIKELPKRIGEEVVLRGWLMTSRSSGKIAFLQVRDGSGVVQAVASRAELSERAWEEVQKATQESTLRLTGTVSEDPRSPSGVEIHLSDLVVEHLPEEFPISKKEHGIGFLMEHRHLWLRSSRQRAALRVRSEVSQAIRDFHYERDFVLIDSPILTPAACEGTSTLFETDYFGEQRRHLMEFWMVEPEVAFLEFEGLCDLAEEFISYLVARVLDRCAPELEVLERDTSKLVAATSPFPRITYTEAIESLKKAGVSIEWGEDFGGDDETILAEQFDRPVLVTHYPTALKAFYMEPDPENPELALALDVLAPEGYGEIIGGSQRIHDHDLLKRRLEEHELPLDAFQWYLDVRRYGTFPHSGFGMGIERFVAWVCGLKHLRETIPYPRMLNKIYP